MPASNHRSARFPLIAGLALLLFFASLPGLVWQASDVDLLLYAAAAVRANAAGALPYEVAWIEKGPLAMGLFQGLFALFGPYNFAAIGLAWLVLALVTAALSWRLAEAIGPPGSGPWAAALFAVSIGAIGGTLNTEVPAAAAAAGCLLAWYGSSRAATVSSGCARAAGAGALAAAAFLCRQNAGALLPILLAAEAWRAIRGGAGRRAALARGAAFAGAFTALAGGTVALYALRGTLAPFLFCFYTYNRDIYVAATRVDTARLLASPLVAGRNFLLPIRTAAVAGFLGIAIVAARLFTPRRRGGAATGSGADSSDAVVLVVVALGLTASLFVGLRLFTHYFTLVLPFWTALGGVALASLAGASRPASAASEVLTPPASSTPKKGSDPFSARRPSRARVLAVAAVVALSLLAELRGRGILSSGRALLRLARAGPAIASDPAAWPGADPLCAAAAGWIRQHSRAEDRVFVWGTRPHVLAYANRVAATRFTTCTFLSGLVPWERSAPEEDTTRWIVPGSWELFSADLDAERPRFIVDASNDHLFGAGAYAPDRFPPLGEALRRDYARVFETGEGDRLIVYERREPVAPGQRM